jgi:hypothetical protein
MGSNEPPMELDSTQYVRKIVWWCIWDWQHLQRLSRELNKSSDTRFFKVLMH